MQNDRIFSIPEHFVCPAAIVEDVQFKAMIEAFRAKFRNADKKSLHYCRSISVTLCTDPTAFYTWLEQREATRAYPVTHAALLRHALLQRDAERTVAGKTIITFPGLGGKYYTHVKNIRAVPFIVSSTVWKYPKTYTRLDAVTLAAAMFSSELVAIDDPDLLHECLEPGSAVNLMVKCQAPGCYEAYQCSSSVLHSPLYYPHGRPGTVDIPDELLERELFSHQLAQHITRHISDLQNLFRCSICFETLYSTVVTTHFQDQLSEDSDGDVSSDIALTDAQGLSLAGMQSPPGASHGTSTPTPSFPSEDAPREKSLELQKAYFSSTASFIAHMQTHSVLVLKQHAKILQDRGVLKEWNSSSHIRIYGLPYMCPVCLWPSDDIESIYEHIDKMHTFWERNGFDSVMPNLYALRIRFKRDKDQAD